MSALVPDDTLLGLLAIRAQHGYDLLDCFQQPDGLGRVWTLSTSQLYSVLKRLERRGWIVGHDETPPNAPTRTVYRITPDGDAQMRAWLADPAPSASIRAVRVEFLSRLYIARGLGLPTAGIIDAQQAACARRRDALRAELRPAREADGPDDIGQLALRLHLAQLDAVIGWIQTEIAR